MNVATAPFWTHALKSITCSSLFTASPACRSIAWIVCVMSFTNGANCFVTRPGAPRPHTNERKPEQSERYGFHVALSGRVQIAEHHGSMSCTWFGTWQYGIFTATHDSARAMTSLRETRSDSLDRASSCEDEHAARARNATATATSFMKVTIERRSPITT